MRTCVGPGSGSGTSTEAHAFGFAPIVTCQAFMISSDYCGVTFAAERRSTDPVRESPRRPCAATRRRSSRRFWNRASPPGPRPCRPSNRRARSGHVPRIGQFVPRLLPAPAASIITSQPPNVSLVNRGASSAAWMFMPVIDDVGDELRVRLRLVQSAHDAEADVHVVLLHEPRNDGVERALPRREHVRDVPDRDRTARPGSAGGSPSPPPARRTRNSDTRSGSARRCCRPRSTTVR